MNKTCQICNTIQCDYKILSSTLLTHIIAGKIMLIPKKYNHILHKGHYICVKCFLDGNRPDYFYGSVTTKCSNCKKDYIVVCLGAKSESDINFNRGEWCDSIVDGNSIYCNVYSLYDLYFVNFNHKKPDYINNGDNICDYCIDDFIESELCTVPILKNPQL